MDVASSHITEQYSQVISTSVFYCAYINTIDIYNKHTHDARYTHMDGRHFTEITVALLISVNVFFFFPLLLLLGCVHDAHTSVVMRSLYINAISPNDGGVFYTITLNISYMPCTTCCEIVSVSRSMV